MAINQAICPNGCILRFAEQNGNSSKIIAIEVLTTSNAMIFTNIVLNTETLFHLYSISYAYSNSRKAVMRKVMFIITILLNGIILFYACKKDKETNPDYDTNTAQDNSFAESTFNDINNITIEAVESHDVNTYRIPNQESSLLSTCASVTVALDSPGAVSGNIIIDFGATNCFCLDGRYRRGKINVAFNGYYHTNGSVITTTFTDYFVGRETAHMYQVTGTKTVTNNGTNANNHLNFTIVVDGHLINSNGEHMNWYSNRNREWIAGETTSSWLDDEYVITGSANGTNFEGNSFSASITEGLHVKLSCRWITQGKFELTPTGKSTRSFDYGNGDCDSKATVSVNGKVFEITMR